MNQPKSVGQLCDMLWQLENEFDLLDIEIQGVKVWQYMCAEIYYTIAEKKGVLQPAHAQKQTIYGWLKKLFAYTKKPLFYNSFFIFNYNMDEIVIDQPRPDYFGGECIDIYTQYYLHELGQNEKDYMVLEHHILNEFHTKAYAARSKYLDAIIVMSALQGKLFPARLIEGEKNLIKKLEEALNEQFEVDIGLLSVLTIAVIKFQCSYVMYRYLLSKLRPYKLIVAVSYAYGDVIKAVKDLGVEAVEIQHGTPSKYHLGYSFPNRIGSLEYFPDMFMAWGLYWKKLNIMPLSEKTIIVCSFTHFNYIFISVYGAIGAAYATIITLFISYVITLRYVQSSYQLPYMQAWSGSLVKADV